MSAKGDTYAIGNITVTVQRIFAGDRTVKALLAELLRKRYAAAAMTRREAPR